MRLGLPRLRKSGNERRLDSLPKGSENQRKNNNLEPYLNLMLKSFRIALIAAISGFNT